MFKPQLTRSNVLDLTFEQYAEIAQELTKIDKMNLEDELSRHTVIYAYYHGLLVMVKSLLDKQILECEVSNSQIRNEAISHYKTDGIKPTVNLIDNYIHGNQKYRECQLMINHLEEIHGYVKGLCFAMEHKKDMLVQLSANNRSEIKLNN